LYFQEREKGISLPTATNTRAKSGNTTVEWTQANEGKLTNQSKLEDALNRELEGYNSHDEGWGLPSTENEQTPRVGGIEKE